MKSINLTKKEVSELRQALDIAEKTIRRIHDLSVFDVKLDDLWELRNYSQQISAILYNIHGGVYRAGVAS